MMRPSEAHELFFLATFASRAIPPPLSPPHETRTTFPARLRPRPKRLRHTMSLVADIVGYWGFSRQDLVRMLVLILFAVVMERLVHALSFVIAALYGNKAPKARPASAVRSSWHQTHAGMRPHAQTPLATLHACVSCVCVCVHMLTHLHPNAPVYWFPEGRARRGCVAAA